MSSNNYFKVKEAFFFFHDADRTSCASAWDHAKLAAGEEHPVAVFRAFGARATDAWRSADIVGLSSRFRARRTLAKKDASANVLVRARCVADIAAVDREWSAYDRLAVAS